MRVIQDSEDEDDFEIEVPLAEPQQCDAAPAHDSNAELSRPGEKCTGSTESLRRAIVTAHHAQFRDGALSSERQDLGNPSLLPAAANSAGGTAALDGSGSSISLTGHANKQRRTSLDGSHSTRDFSPITQGNRHHGQIDDTINGHPGPDLDRPWNLQGTMREDWEHHEPMGLFPPSASSTIPNATATQQQLLAEVLAPSFLGVETEAESYDAPKYEPAKSSVPWSEYLKSSSEVHALPRSAEHTLLNSPNNECISKEPATATQSPVHIIVGPLDEGVNSPPRPVVEPFSDNEEISSQSKLRSSPDPIVSPLRKVTPKSDCTPAFEHDFSAIGIPEEQYKPRPSRSRSLKLSGEVPIDYSKRPEAAVKKARRTRTSGDAGTASTATTPEKVRQICDMGFTTSATKKALRQHNGDVTHTVNWLIANGGTSEDELAPSKTPRPDTKRKSKRASGVQDHPTEVNQGKEPESAVEEPIASVSMDPQTILDDVAQSAPTSMVTKSPTVVKVVIPRIKNTATPPRSDEWQATTATSVQPMDDSRTTSGQSDVQLESQPDTSSHMPKGKKRGRGRPKKENKKIESIEEETSEDKIPETQSPIQDALPMETNNVGKPGDTDVDQVKETVDAESHPDRTRTTPEPPPEKKVKHANDAPSSINKGKTPYRVGLSKRARIAPLLRIVKK